MEITLDARFIQHILAQEYELARADLRSVGAYQALAHSQQRHDARLAAARPR
jgi:hypothetical protein